MRTVCAIVVLLCLTSSPVAAQSAQPSESTPPRSERSGRLMLTGEKPRADGLANGIWWGLAAGLAAGGLSDPIACRHSSERGDCMNAYGLVIVPIWGAGGAVVGALIDRHFKHYPASAGIAFKDAIVRINPVVTAHRRGVTVSVDF